MPKFLVDKFLLLGLFGGLAVLFHYFAYKRRIFSTRNFTPFPLRIPIGTVLLAFLIYFFPILLISPFLYLHLSQWGFSSITSQAVSQIISYLVGILGLIYLSLHLKSPLVAFIWKRSKQPKINDFVIGILFWLLAFPTVSFLYEFFDLIITLLFHVTPKAQNAIAYLKESKTSPLLLTLALISIIVIAPILEEYLFRGFLQSYFSKRIGVKPAILLSSLLFACLHLSPSQGFSNIPIGVSILVLGMYLGYLYEKRHSLYANIGLHITFNVIAVIWTL